MPSKNINEPLEFIPSLCRGLSFARKIYFLTFTAKETLQTDGLTRVLPGTTIAQEWKILLTTDGEIELVKEGYLPIDLPTRKVKIVSWDSVPPALRPIATLTWVIVEEADGKRKKIAEFTQGEIDSGIFKFLQVAGVNYLLARATNLTATDKRGGEND